jgi:hypothetical protein
MKLDKQGKIMVAGAVVAVAVVAMFLLLSVGGAAGVRYMPGVDSSNVSKYVQVQCDVAILEPMGVMYRIDVTNYHVDLLDAVPMAQARIVQSHSVDFVLKATLMLVSDPAQTAFVDQDIVTADLSASAQTISVGECIGAKAGNYMLTLASMELYNGAWQERVIGRVAVVIP